MLDGVSPPCGRDQQLAATGPVRRTGEAAGTGYHAVLELDAAWLPAGTALPRGLGGRPYVTDFNRHLVGLIEVVHEFHA